MAILIPIVESGLPIMDTLLAIARRIYRGLPILIPEREHIRGKRLFRRFLKHASFIKGVLSPRKLLGADRKNPEFVQPGHFYSAIPDFEEVKRHEKKIFRRVGKEIPGIDLHEDDQFGLLKQFRKYYKEIPFGPHKKDKLRYYFENSFYTYSDAIFLYFMIRHARPTNIIEIGSGFSSCVILDTNDIFFGGSISCKFIEPFPERLISLLKHGEKNKIDILKMRLQDVDLNLFTSLSHEDILLIDSTHVSKVASDVNYVFFDILPILNSGVYVHFHDIFFPFQYPKEWIFAGRAWNEAYILRAFLQFNSAFKIVLFNTFLEQFYEDFFGNEMPLCLKNKGGSIWLQKL